MSNHTDTKRTDTLNMETGTIEWSELITHFARGVVITVSAEMDLVEVASRLAADDTTMLQSWLQQGLVSRASDDDARDWTARDPLFWCVVVAPWVLVQENESVDKVH